MSSTHKLQTPFPLVGRAQELDDLEEILEGGGSGYSVVFVRGEEGVGKTRLAAELAKRATNRNWQVAAGRAYPVESGVPYAVLSDAWLPILQALDPSSLTVLSRGGEAELRYLFPALGGKIEALDDGALTDRGEFRTRLMWNFAEFLKRLAARTPVLCILEDLQWADDSSLELIHFLGRQARGHPILLLCTYNDQDRDRKHQLVETERSLESIGAGNVIRLEPLSLDDVTELVCRSFSMEVDLVREFSAVLHDWTRGNAFFLEEIVKWLVSTGSLRQENGAWIGWDSRDFGMPASIRDAIMAPVHGFSKPARRVADVAAIVGTRVSYKLIESISGLDSTQVLAALEELCGRGMLDERPEGGEVVYHFRHPLVRQTLYDELGFQRARMLHGVVAEAMEEYYGSKSEEHADELAFHFAHTDGSMVRAKATKYLATAGRMALDRRADQQAIDYLEAAVSRVEESGAEDPTALDELLPLLARAHTRMGHFDTAAGHWASLLSRVDADRPEYPAIRRALGMTNVWRGRHDEAEQHFRAGLAAATAGGDEPATVRLLVAQAHALHEVGRGADALTVLARALPIAEGLGDSWLLARVHRALALLHVWVGPPEKAIEHGEKAIELARDVGDLSIEFWALWGLAVLYGMRGDTQRMARGIEDINEIADRARSPVLRLWTADMSVELAYGQGEWDAGIARGEQAISLARSLSQRTLLPRLLVWTSLFYVARGELEQAEALINEAVEMAGLDDEHGSIDVHQVVPTYIGLAHYLVALGDYEDAIDAAEKGLQISEGTGYVLWTIHQLLPILVEACLWAGHIDRAEEVGRRMRAHADRIDHRIGRAWADACDSLVQWKRGDPEGAVELMKTAADELDRIPMIWSATRLRRQLAGRLLEIGRRAEGIEELGRVHDVCVRLRAGLELEKTRAMYREAGMRPPPVPVENGPMGLTPSELRVGTLVAGGMSNKAIADELTCATRTVSTHLSNIYAKLDIGGPGARVRLGNQIREAGLLE